MRASVYHNSQPGLPRNVQFGRLGGGERERGERPARSTARQRLRGHRARRPLSPLCWYQLLRSAPPPPSPPRPPEWHGCLELHARCTPPLPSTLRGIMGGTIRVGMARGMPRRWTEFRFCLSLSARARQNVNHALTKRPALVTVARLGNQSYLHLSFRRIPD